MLAWQVHYLEHKSYMGWTFIRCRAPPVMVLLVNWGKIGVGHFKGT